MFSEICPALTSLLCHLVVAGWLLPVILVDSSDEGKMHTIAKRTMHTKLYNVVLSNVGSHVEGL